MDVEEIKKLASENKNEAVERVFDRLLLKKIVDITGRLLPPPEATETVEKVLARAVEDGDREAKELVTDAGREIVRQEARGVVEDLLAEESSGTPD